MPFLIVLMGIDGAGKTAQVDLLEARLSEWGYSVRRENSPAYTLLDTIPRLFRRFQAFNAADKIEQSTPATRSIARSKAVSLLFSIATFVDFLLTHWRLRLLKSCPVLICDRYAYDQMVKFVDLGIYSRALFNWILRRLPRPDVVFLLDCSPNTAYARKGELTPTVLERRRELYLEVARQLGEKAHIVNSEPGPQEVERQILNLLTLYTKIRTPRLV